jgi:serine protease Do
MPGRAAFFCATLLLAAGSTAAAPAAPRPGKSSAPAAPAPAPRGGGGAPFCSGEYADFLTAMSRDTRTFEASAASGYTYCIRTTATYEHVFYAKGGELRRRYVRHVRHGTGFAYQKKDGAWYVATNEHVASHPLVTEADSDVEGVPAGARKVRETVRIVASESDDDEPSQVPLDKVLSDEDLDLAVLKTSRPLNVMPYRIGHSSALRVGNAVQVRGYPLGVFAASNSGRVISVAQPDHERGWNHEDFAVDALLNAGNSGSPVFAVSCRTGELELVGIYHAGYKDAQALNVVVSVDQLRRALETLQTRPREQADDPVDRKALVARLRASPGAFVMPFGDRTVRVDVTGDTVRFGLLDAEYPLTTSVQVGVVDRGGDLASPAALQLPRRFGDQEIPWVALDPGLHDAAQRLHDGLWRQLAAVLAFRAGEDRKRPGPDARALVAAEATRIRGRRSEQRDLLQAIDFDAEDIVWRAGAAPATSAASQPGGSD